ncbi:hypothetical protein H696_05414 [Fonticula alba]|uniref:TKL protein kinase n=1 Tax=Fonticula alba TaxID=691883 RepID=A0A058Z2I5_FONAL|nr:hypothetical protein H696_05414 [Fonticula alba]KCV68148.1 hypothetical protein H696_05414 [Fonticula alba]|eukprot:XP_009497522.1 hypothetical protein H696_05414 [Fonticula alba]
MSPAGDAHPKRLPRPTGPLLRLATAVLAVGGTLLMWGVAMSAGATGPALYMHIVPQTLGTQNNMVGFFTPASDVSMTTLIYPPQWMEVRRQWHPSAELTEHRWGPYFDRHLKLSISRPRPPLVGEPKILALPLAGSENPVLVEYTPEEVAFFDQPDAWALFRAPVVVLSALASSPSAVDLLALAGPATGPRQPIIIQLSINVMLETELDVPAIVGPSLAAPAGQPRSFYLYGDGILHEVAADPSGVREVGVLPLPDVTALRSTRLLPAPGGAACDTDLLLAFSDGRVQARLCHSLSAQPGESALLEALLPAGAGPDGHFLNPSVESMAEPMGFVYFLSSSPPRPVLWRAVISPAGFGPWRDVRISSYFEMHSLQMLRMRLAAGRQEWVVASKDGAIFLDSDDFGCTTDDTIRCTEPPASSAVWSCNLGRTQSPFLDFGRMCSGCPDGSYLDRDSDTCKFCPQANCLTCSAAQCHVCASGFFPQASGPNGRIVCVDTCAAGFTLLAGVCQPSARAVASSELASMGVASFAEPISGMVSAATASHLLPDAQGNPYIPAGSMANPDGPAPGVILFDTDGQAWLMPRGDVAQPGAAPVVLSRLSDLSGGPLLASVVEVGPILLEDSILLGYVFCTKPAGLLFGYMKCPRPVAPMPGDVPCSVATLELHPQPGTAFTHARSVGREHVLATQADAYNLLLVLAGGTFRPVGPSYLGHLVPLLTIPRPAGAGSGNLAEWFIRSEFTMGVVAAPLAAVMANHHYVAMGGGVHIAGATGIKWMPMFLPVRDRSPGHQLVLTTIESGTWRAIYAPGDIGPAGRPTNLSSLSATLGTVGDLNQEACRFEAVPMPAGRADTPAGLLLLCDGLLGLSLLRCPASGPGAGGACALLPASVIALPLHGGDVLKGLARATVIPRPGAAPVADRHILLEALLYLPTVGTLDLVLTGPCAWGTFEPECQPCDSLCDGCTGPGPQDCVACLFWLPGHPGTCLPSCPPKLHRAPDGECMCHSTCVDCGPAAGGDYVCLECLPGLGPDAHGADPDQCFPCDGSCAECFLSANPGACTKCHPSAWLFGGACVGACPSGFWPDSASGSCLPCAAGCAACTGASACTRCADRHFLAAGVCHVCDGSCASCDNATSCAACRPGLVFLATDAGQASLCGSTCAAGEFAGPGRCAVCDASCALCAGSATGCQVCAAGHRWVSGPPAAGGTGSCTACPPGCASCTADRCLACESGLFLDSRGACVSACPAGTYPTDESCQPCDLSCATCLGGGADQCASCADGLDFVPAGGSAGACVSGCPEGQYRDRVSVRRDPEHRVPAGLPG